MNTCDQYWLFSPNYWLCNAPVAVGKGIGQVSGDAVGDKLNNLGQNIASQADKLVAGIGQGLSEAVNRGISNLSSLEIPNATELGRLATEKIQEFIKGSGMNDMGGKNLGDSLGKEFNSFFSNFIDSLGISDHSGRLGDEFAESFAKFMKNLKLKDSVNTASAEISPAIQRFFEEFRKNSVNEFDLLRADIQRVISNSGRDYALTFIPWIALSLMILVGAPLATHYLYKKMVHNIGKPKLAQERKNYNYFDRAYDGLLNVVGGAYSSVKTFAKWTTVSGASAFGMALLGSVVINCINLSKNSYKDYYEDVPGNIVGDFFCNLFNNNYYRRCDSSNGNLSIVIASCVAIGTVASIYKGFNAIRDGFKNYLKPEVKPIFNDEVKEVIDEVTQSTLNHKNNGGFFENILLFGPGGTGKTMISKYIAKNAKMNYVFMSGGDLAQYIKRGEHVTELNKLFSDANSSNGQTIIFIDEAESLCKDREEMHSNEHIELLNAFLNLTGEQSKKFMLILTTNRAQDLDPAVLSRMDHKVHIGPPEHQQRIEILNLYIAQFFSKNEISEFFDATNVEKMAKETEGLTGRALFKMLNSLANKKSGSDNNKLTHEMIEKTLHHFTEQEKLIKLNGHMQTVTPVAHAG